MLRRAFSYSDALKLLGADRSVLDLVDKLSSGVLVLTGHHQLLGARTELVKLGRTVIDGLKDRVRGLKRVDRTKRLEAAHAVLVVTAYFEALDLAELPVRLDDIKLSRNEQLATVARGQAVATNEVPSSRRDPLDSIESSDARDLLSAQLPVPSPTAAHEEVIRRINEMYVLMGGRIVLFTRALEVWDRLDETSQGRFYDGLKVEVPDRAVRRYEELYRKLAVDCPEFFVWAEMQEHAATRTSVSTLDGSVSARLDKLHQLFQRQDTALAGMRVFLESLDSGQQPEQLRANLARSYTRDLSRPVAQTGDMPDGMVMPSLESAYVNPRFRVAEVFSDADPSQDSWWTDRPVRDDARAFLAGHFTSSQATSAPLLVLGQPGSGKSVLSKILAAQLPSKDFLPVRVSLRDVPTEADLQDQIEYAIRDATGDPIDWPTLSRMAGDALPVVMLDGFDELLQATGANRSDYLQRVQRFQQREEDLSRPVAVMVTSRTAVANRARCPHRTVALRLEPFDNPQVEHWLNVWNRTNDQFFTDNGLRPLQADVALRTPELAGQPLLLMMLALYDADDNALQRSDSALVKAELYERLLDRFARREVSKSKPELPASAMPDSVEWELRGLSVVALAMFNRGTQWVGEADLNADLVALRQHQNSSIAQGMRAPLTAAQIVVGRFFFIHETHALRDETALQTYEFLHATFGEYLVARTVDRELRAMVRREDVRDAFVADDPDDSRLHAFLSFAPLTARTPIVDFLCELFATWKDHDRTICRRLMLRLFHASDQERKNQHYADYQPRPTPVARRIATYSANLTVLVMLVRGDVHASELFPDADDPVTSWHHQALLWRSQLSTDEWTSLVGAFQPERKGESDEWPIILGARQAIGKPRDICLTLDKGDFSLPPVSWNWWPDPAPYIDSVQRENYFLCGLNEDLTTHVLEPLVETFGTTFHNITTQPSGPILDVHARLLLWLSRVQGQSADERAAQYKELYNKMIISVRPKPSSAPHERDYRPWISLLQLMTQDESVPAEVVLDTLSFDHVDQLPPRLIVDSVMSAFGTGPDTDERALTLLENTLYRLTLDDLDDHMMVLRAWLCVNEFALKPHATFGENILSEEPASLLNDRLDLPALFSADPGLVRRAKWAAMALGVADEIAWPEGC